MKQLQKGSRCVRCILIPDIQVDGSGKKLPTESLIQQFLAEKAGRVLESNSGSETSCLGEQIISAFLDGSKCSCGLREVLTADRCFIFLIAVSTPSVLCPSCNTMRRQLRTWIRKVKIMQ